jgi:hypothetical protein
MNTVNAVRDEMQFEKIASDKMEKKRGKTDQKMIFNWSTNKLSCYRLHYSLL